MDLFLGVLLWKGLAGWAVGAPRSPSSGTAWEGEMKTGGRGHVK